MFGRISKFVRMGMWPAMAISETASAIVVGAGNNSQALAVPLNAEINSLSTTSATASTGVLLPKSIEPGSQVAVFNGGANSTLAYPQVGGQVDALGVNAGFTIAAGKKVIFLSTGPNTWLAFLSA